MMNDKSTKPINIEKRRDHHLAVSYMAQYSAQAEESKGTVAFKHLVRIWLQHRAIADFLDLLLTTYTSFSRR